MWEKNYVGVVSCSLYNSSKLLDPYAFLFENDPNRLKKRAIDPNSK